MIARTTAAATIPVTAYRSRNRTVGNVTAIARGRREHCVLIQRRRASQLCGRPTPAAGPALGCPRIPTRGHTARLVGGFHTGNGEQHWIMPSPDPIDVHVGLRIRQRRVLLGMSMETLGAAVGLSFQMVQKYEVGINSIAASRLVDVAKALDVPPSFFFEGPRPRAKVALYKSPIALAGSGKRSVGADRLIGVLELRKRLQGIFGGAGEHHLLVAHLESIVGHHDIFGAHAQEAAD